MPRLLQRFTFRIERLLVRGAQYRLLLIAAAIGLISILGGALVLWAGTGFGHFGEATWWAFLRLTDPGYLGDDVGTVNRVVSTVLTVLGYVVFLGALVAVMTQALNERMARLESGLTPVARDDHVVILGWTNRTEAIIRELLASRRRVRSFLRRHGVRDLHVVVLARTVTAALAQDLRDAIGEAWEEHRVTLRSGTALRPEHLDRVDAVNAAAVIIPAAEYGEGGADRADTHTIKALLSLGRPGRGGDPPPYVVAEIFDREKALLAEHIYPGELEVVSSHAVVSRLLAQNVRHPGLSQVYTQLLTQRKGVDLFIREIDDERRGTAFGDLYRLYPRAILIGLVRATADDLVPHLNPPSDFRLASGDRLVLLAHSYGHTDPDGRRPSPRGGEARGAATPPEPTGGAAAASSAPAVGAGAGKHERRVLILGWNHKVPALVEEFASYPGERFTLDVASAVPPEERARHLGRLPADADVAVTQVHADYTALDQLAAMEPHTYDAVLLMGSDWLGSSEESDARTLLGFLLLRQALGGGAGPRPTVIVELLDPDNVRLLGESETEVIISPLIVSHMLAQVALRRELQAVFDDLFTAGGADITFRPATAYVPAGEDVPFSALEAAARQRGHTALGVRSRSRPGHVDLAPDRATRQRVSDDLEIVILA
ncbi:MAG: ion channel DMI1 [Gemmatimonadetes bacterium]|nr:ion channel DMI1 [Gemmatimonadota bacterium]